MPCETPHTASRAPRGSRSLGLVGWWLDISSAVNQAAGPPHGPPPYPSSLAGPSPIAPLSLECLMQHCSGQSPIRKLNFLASQKRLGSWSPWRLCSSGGPIAPATLVSISQESPPWGTDTPQIPPRDTIMCSDFFKVQQLLKEVTLYNISFHSLTGSERAS